MQNADLHKAFALLFGPDGFIEDESAQEKLKAKAKENNADVYLYVTLTWAKKFEIDLSKYPNLNAFIKCIESDEGLTAVIEQQGLEKIGSL